MEKSSSLVDHLTAARNSLTQETWRKGNYFSTLNDKVCMCAHGALQAQVNPNCAKQLALVVSSNLDYVQPNFGAEGAAIEGNKDAVFKLNEKAAVAPERRAFLANERVNHTASASPELAARIGEITTRREPAMQTLPKVSTLIPIAAGEASYAVSINKQDERRSVLRQIWNTRPIWVKQNKDNSGHLDAHYLLGMVGLTTGFNDSRFTTLDLVHQKFDEAIELAQQLT